MQLVKLLLGSDCSHRAGRKLYLNVFNIDLECLLLGAGCWVEAPCHSSVSICPNLIGQFETRQSLGFKSNQSAVGLGGSGRRGLADLGILESLNSYF